MYVTASHCGAVFAERGNGSFDKKRQQKKTHQDVHEFGTKDLTNFQQTCSKSLF